MRSNHSLFQAWFYFSSGLSRSVGKWAVVTTRVAAKAARAAKVGRVVTRAARAAKVGRVVARAVKAVKEVRAVRAARAARAAVTGLRSAPARAVRSR
ncbi:MAG TPA: hypothetical protein VE093_46110 [Polyangiaceae bacterium]|nr:hypothetical protein [Polyangiaceae bacterium]